MKRWTCQKCDKGTDRRQGICDKGGKHEWIDTREYWRRKEEYKKYQQKRYENYINSPQGRQEIINGKNAVIEYNNAIIAHNNAIKNAIIAHNNAIIKEINLLIKLQKKLISNRKLFLLLIFIAGIPLCFSFGLFSGINVPWYIPFSLMFLFSLLREICRNKISKTEDKIMNLKGTLKEDVLKEDVLKEDNTEQKIKSRFFDLDWKDYWTAWERKKEYAVSLFRSKNYAEAADEYRKIGSECGLPTFSAPAWLNAAHCYDMLHDGHTERTLACYRNAVVGYTKLVSQGHEGAQERLAEAERDLAKFLDRKN
jgi:hypothetical protein